MCVSGLFCPQTNAEGYSDNATYEKLLKLEMIDERDETQDSISRGEFCGILLRYMDIPLETGYKQTEFTDVSVNSEYFYEITTAYKWELAFGSDNRMFYPDEPIRLKDVCTMMIRALGYEKYQSFGSYEQYMSYASSLGMLDGVSIKADDFIDYETLLTVFDNCLDVKILTRVPTAGSSVKFEDFETLLEYKKKIKSYNGTVTANRFSSLADSGEAVNENKIAIDGIIYDTDDNYDALLGCNVDFYLTKDDRVVYIEQTNKNNELVVMKDDVKSISNSSIEYYTNDKGKSTKVKISPKYVLFNDEAISGYGKLSDIQWDSGYVRLLDCDNDGEYESVFFYEYDAYVVGNVNADSNVIYDKISGKQIKLDQDEDAIIEIYNSDMEITDISELKEYDVLNVIWNEKGIHNHTRVYVTRNTVSGKVESVNDTEGYIAIDGEQIDISRDYMNIPEVGKTGTLYTDKLGYGVYFEESAVKDDYLMGIVLSHNVNTEAYESREEIYVRLFTSDSETQKYKLGDTISLNGKAKSLGKRKSFDDVAAAIVKDDVVRYKVTDGTITEIFTPSTQSGADDIAFRLKTSGSSFYYNDTMINGELYMDGKSTIFNKETDSNGNVEYSTMAYTDLRAGYNYVTPYKVYTYGDGDEFYAEAVLFTNWKCETYFDNSNIAVVEECRYVYNETDAEVRARIYFTQTSLSSEYTLARGLESAMDILQEGDLIRYQVNSKNEISRITMVMRADGLKGDYTDLYVDTNGAFAGGGDGALIYPNEAVGDAVWMAAGNGASITRDNDVFYCNFKAVYATVKNVIGNYVVYSVNYESNGSIKTKDYVAHANSTTYCTDTRNDEIKSMELADVTVGDTVVLQMYSGTIRRLIELD